MDANRITNANTIANTITIITFYKQGYNQLDEHDHEHDL